MKYHGSYYSQGKYTEKNPYPEDDNRPRDGTPNAIGEVSFDCSALVWRVYHECGFYTPNAAWFTGTAADTLDNKNYYMSIEHKDLSPGDIILADGHMQIYGGEKAQAAAEQCDRCTIRNENNYTAIAASGHANNPHGVCFQVARTDAKFYRPIAKK